ncbi:tyrosine-protein phosphatase [Demequina sp. NBRC 110057]|uniref:tyrosine-protein phosphatase n=1 Tax=Demequina sp. NBRC 110057 TaxID=1570346 RepID=UPI0013563D5E|nr:tyrosine-protein phosphatase [Demequina sp. NBRC 110057]
MLDALPDPQPRLANARDLAAASAIVAPGILFRSDAPAAGDEAPEGLRPWPPATVIDMRGLAEKAHPHALADASRVVDLPVLDEADLTGERARQTAMSLEALYARMTEGASAAALTRGVAEVANAEAPVLMHCSAGKDRTGVLAALVLALLGAERQDIVDDYTTTATHMGGVLARMMRGMRPEFAAAAVSQSASELLDAPRHAIQFVLDRWDAEGGVEAWYLAHGGDDETLARLRARLLAG